MDRQEHTNFSQILSDVKTLIPFKKCIWKWPELVLNQTDAVSIGSALDQFWPILANLQGLPV